MASTNPKYNTSKTYLQHQLFKVVPPKLKEVHWPVINITVLPDYLAYLKALMTEEERILLSQYNLQTYLIEGAFTFSPHASFDQLTSQILTFIRENNRFWVRKMGAEQDKLTRHHAIEEYHKDIQALRQEGLEENYPTKAFRISERKIIHDGYSYSIMAKSKPTYKFTANLFTALILYCLGKQEQSVENSVEKKFLFELLNSFALNFKQKPKKGYVGIVLPTQEEKSANSEAEEVMQDFEEWLEDQGIDEKSLSSQKEYYFMANMIRIIKNMEGGEKLRKKQGKEEPVNICKEDEFQELQNNCASKMYTQHQVKLLVHYIEIQLRQNLINVIMEREKQEMEWEQKWRGFLSPPSLIQAAFLEYQQIIAHPENANQTKYKVTGAQVPWTDEEYKMFLINFKQLFNVPTNNKKIALGMGKDIESSHVKYVKGIYMRNMGNRIDNGEIGGGKKGVFDSKFNFLERDIENFNMRWFKKDSKSKSKKIKKRRKRPNFDGQEEDSDYY